MGFYSPQSLVADATRHGVETRRPDIQLSGVEAGLELLDPSPGDRVASVSRSTGPDACLDPHQPEVEAFDLSAPFDSADHRRDGRYAVRLGLAAVSSIGVRKAEQIVAERDRGGAYRDMRDLARRVGLNSAQLEALAAAGAFDTLGLSRRGALWDAEQASQERPDQLQGSHLTVQPPLFAMLTGEEQVINDLWSTGVTPDD